MTTAQRILVQVRAIARKIVLRMAPYYQPDHTDELHFAADLVTMQKVHQLLHGKAILGTDNLLKLADKIGLVDLMDEDFYVEPVVEYIIAHAADCDQLWAHVRHLRDNPPL